MIEVIVPKPVCDECMREGEAGETFFVSAKQTLCDACAQTYQVTVE